MQEPGVLANNTNRPTASTRTSKKNESQTFSKYDHSVSGTKNLDNHLTDSGFESFERHSGLKYKKIKSRASVIKTESKFVPFDVSFVGGKFNLNVYKVKVPTPFTHPLGLILYTEQFLTNYRKSNIRRRSTSIQYFR